MKKSYIFKESDMVESPAVYEYYEEIFACAEGIDGVNEEEFDKFKESMEKAAEQVWLMGLEDQESYYPYVLYCDGMKDLVEYFFREYNDEKEYTEEDFDKMKKILEVYKEEEDGNKENLCAAFNIVYGGDWHYTKLNGTNCSGCVTIYYNSNFWNKDALNNFCIEYLEYGTGFYCEETGDEIYCHTWGESNIKKEIADYMGCAVDQIVIEK